MSMGYVKLPCKFCGRPVLNGRCDWRGMFPVKVAARTLRVGDVWITQQRKKRGRVAEIIEINRYSRQIWVKLPEKKDAYPYIKYNFDPVITEALRVCGKPCCELHRRHPGPKVHYCADHWDCREQAA